MNKYAEEYKLNYPKALGGALFFLLISIYLITRGDKPREEFLHQQGTITYLSHVHPLRSESAPRPKDVYLIIHGLDRVFELFTGTDKGDFSPRVNRLEELKVGDKVDIYYEEDSQTQFDDVNRVLQYLDKDGELFYLRSKADKYIGYFILGCSGFLLVLGIFMKIKSNHYTKELQADMSELTP